ncbi:MAG: dimethyl sulfoxide reductase anchor subunit family protein [Alphaproteobacteria bacterium]
MFPAFSLIFFTTASGAGYGLLAVLGVLTPAGLLPAERWLGFAGLMLALGPITFGLLSSTFHLGHPERAWRAVTQWRSSWLSREGVMALVTYLPAGLFGIGWVFLETAAGAWGLFGVLSAVCAALTVICTGMIYAVLQPVPQWNNSLVVPNYCALALMTGALWLNALVHLFGLGGRVVSGLAVLSILLAWALKHAYWRHIDSAKGASTPETATGLKALGEVRLLDAPHTEENYLMREMGFHIARKHALKLRRLAVAGGFATPLLLTLLLLVLSGWGAIVAALVAAAAATAGVLIERWLFFAEAKHRLTLYYGARAV